MNNLLVQRITEVFRPQVPLWACEITGKHVIVAGVQKGRKRIRNKVAVELPPNAVLGSLSEVNIS